MDMVNPGELDVGGPGWPRVLYFLRVVAVVFGYLLAGSGWLFFLVFSGATGFAELDPRDAEFFMFIGALVTPGWLLLRFAGGLFPFGRHFFPWQKHHG